MTSVYSWNAHISENFLRQFSYFVDILLSQSLGETITYLVGNFSHTVLVVLLDSLPKESGSSGTSTDYTAASNPPPSAPDVGTSPSTSVLELAWE